MKLLNEFVLKFKCKKCKNTKISVFPCSGSIAVMKAGLKNPDKCRKCGKNDWVVFGVLNVEVE